MYCDDIQKLLLVKIVTVDLCGVGFEYHAILEICDFA